MPRAEHRHEYLTTLTFDILSDDFIDWNKLEENVRGFAGKIEAETLAQLAQASKDEAVRIIASRLTSDADPARMLNCFCLLLGISSGVLLSETNSLKVNAENVENLRKGDLRLAREFAELLVSLGLQRVASPTENTTTLAAKLSGVYVGLECNKRKNRRGGVFETKVMEILSDVQEYLNAEGFPVVLLDKKSLKGRITHKTPDFAFELHGDIVVAIESNYYTGGGSKLSETMRAYDRLKHKLVDDDVEFIWISNGQGAALFAEVPYVMNLFQARTRLKDYLRAIIQTRMR